MPSMIDQIRASKLPSNMMQFAARGALSVPPAENIEILVYLALHNPVFGSVARMTLAGWDEKASLESASNPATAREVLNYMISPDNMRPALLVALLENPSLPEEELAKFAMSASQESIAAMLASVRVQKSDPILEVLRSNPYLKKEQADEVRKLLGGVPQAAAVTAADEAHDRQPEKLAESTAITEKVPEPLPEVEGGDGATVPDEAVASFLTEHAAEIAAEGSKPYQAIGGIGDLLGDSYFPVSQIVDMGAAEAAENAAAAKLLSAAEDDARDAIAKAAAKKKATPASAPVRQNALQKINGLDIKGRIQLALKGNKEERALLIRDGTKIVALAVLEAPKLSDGEVEKFASQKNVLEAVLRYIPLKRRFMKNYIVVRNLVANPRTPLDISLSLMKNLLVQDLKNISTNKDISETIRKLALKNYKQKLDAANKK